MYWDKMTKSFLVCDTEGLQFFPVVVEALVGWHEDDAAPVVSKLAMPARMLRNRPHISARGTVWF